MRITGGPMKGRRLKMPPGRVRPTMDRMRESMFAILGPLDNRSFLDLFAGSGAVSLEAASRGAFRVVAVERNRKTASVLRENVETMVARVEVRVRPVERFIRDTEEVFDLIYVDPPFAYGRHQTLLQEIGRAGILAAEGTLLIHHEGAVLEAPAGWRHTDHRVYGGSLLDFFMPLGAAPESPQPVR